jgi:hypothetical protein
MSLAGILTRVVGSLAAIFAGALLLPITLVSVLSGANMISLNQGIIIFVGFILMVFILLGLIWTKGR